MNCDVDVPQGILDEAGDLLFKRPDLATPLYDGTREISIKLPASWKRRMVSWAISARMRIGAGETLFELQEVGNGTGGGWMGSCMPAPYVAAFLREWIAQGRHVEPLQLELAL